jgi:hypothetical protein
LPRSGACLERSAVHAMDSVEWECGAACRAWICVFVTIYIYIYIYICIYGPGSRTKRRSWRPSLWHIPQAKAASDSWRFAVCPGIWMLPGRRSCVVVQAPNGWPQSRRQTLCRVPRIGLLQHDVKIGAEFRIAMHAWRLDHIILYALPPAHKGEVYRCTLTQFE